MRPHGTTRQVTADRLAPHQGTRRRGPHHRREAGSLGVVDDRSRPPARRSGRTRPGPARVTASPAAFSPEPDGSAGRSGRPNAASRSPARRGSSAAEISRRGEHQRVAARGIDRVLVVRLVEQREHRLPVDAAHRDDRRCSCGRRRPHAAARPEVTRDPVPCSCAVTRTTCSPPAARERDDLADVEREGVGLRVGIHRARRRRSRRCGRRNGFGSGRRRGRASGEEEHGTNAIARAGRPRRRAGTSTASAFQPVTAVGYSATGFNRQTEFGRPPPVAPETSGTNPALVITLVAPPAQMNPAPGEGTAEAERTPMSFVTSRNWFV